MNFTVDYQTVGLLAGSILALTATSISSLKKAMLTTKIVSGTHVKGCIKYDCSKNRKKNYITLTMRFGRGRNKSYRFRDSGIRMSIKPYI